MKVGCSCMRTGGESKLNKLIGFDNEARLTNLNFVI